MPLELKAVLEKCTARLTNDLHCGNTKAWRLAPQRGIMTDELSGRVRAQCTSKPQLR